MNKSQQELLFGKKNYLFMIAGVLVIAFGFILLSGGNSEDINEFSYDIFNSRRIFWAPLTIISGFVIEAIAILKKWKK